MTEHVGYYVGLTPVDLMPMADKDAGHVAGDKCPCRPRVIPTDHGRGEIIIHRKMPDAA